MFDINLASLPTYSALCESIQSMHLVFFLQALNECLIHRADTTFVLLLIQEIIFQI